MSYFVYGLNGPFHGAFTSFDPETGEFIYQADNDYTGMDQFLFGADRLLGGGKADRLPRIQITPPPPTVSVSLDNASPKTNNLLTATATPLDLDGDLVTLTYVWTVNGTVVRTTITTDTTDSLDLSQPDNGDKDDVIAVTVTPSAGTLIGPAASATATVADTRPVVFDSGPLDLSHDRTISGHLSAHDPDDQHLVYFVYGLNGPFHGTFTAFDPYTGDFTYQADSGFIGSDHFLFGVVDLLDGDVGPAAPATATFNVTNAAPAVSVTLSNDAPRTNDILTAVATPSDADGDLWYPDLRLDRQRCGSANAHHHCDHRQPGSEPIESGKQGGCDHRDGDPQRWSS